MEPKEKKLYSPPEITFETQLETKAGTSGDTIDEGIELFPGSND